MADHGYRAVDFVLLPTLQGWHVSVNEGDREVAEPLKQPTDGVQVYCNLIVHDGSKALQEHGWPILWWLSPFLFVLHYPMMCFFELQIQWYIWKIDHDECNLWWCKELDVN